MFLKLEQHSVIDEWVLQEYQAKLLQPWPTRMDHPLIKFAPTKPETVDNYFAVIRSFVARLEEKRLLPYNPARFLPNLGVTLDTATKRLRKFTDTQWPIVLNTLNNLP